MMQEKRYTTVSAGGPGWWHHVSNSSEVCATKSLKGIDLPSSSSPPPPPPPPDVGETRVCTTRGVMP